MFLRTLLARYAPCSSSNVFSLFHDIKPALLLSDWNLIFDIFIPPIVWINSRGSPPLYIARKTSPIIQRVQRPTILHYFPLYIYLKLRLRKSFLFTMILTIIFKVFNNLLRKSLHGTEFPENAEYRISSLLIHVFML